MRFLARVLMVGGLVASLAGCGFQLRGTATLPEGMETTRLVGVAPDTDFADVLEDLLESSGAKVTTDPEESAAEIRILGQRQDRHVYAVGSTGKAREFQLTFTVDFSAALSDGTELLPPESITVRRDYSYDEADVLSREAGEQLLYQSMVEDVAWQIVQRLQAAR